MTNLHDAHDSFNGRQDEVEEAYSDNFVQDGAEAWSEKHNVQTSEQLLYNQCTYRIYEVVS